MNSNRPGSDGEHALQERFGTFKRAAAFYDKQMLDHLNPLMREYLARQEMVFVSTADANGECDSSFRAGPPGFVRVLDDRTVMYPEYRGNGVLASMGNISENPHVGLLFVDFFDSGVGMHINGRARIIEHAAVEAFAPVLERLVGSHYELEDTLGAKRKVPERWILVEIVEAYIHCSKHIPILAHLPGSAGQAPPSGDHFKAKDDERPWVEAPACPVPDFYPEPLDSAAVAESPAVPESPAPADPPEPAPAPAPVDTVAVSPVGVEAYLDVRDADVLPAVQARANDELDALLPPAWAPVG